MENNINEGIKSLRSSARKSRVLLIILKLIFLSVYTLHFPYSLAYQSPKVKGVAMTQIVQPTSLDRARKAILDELKNNGFEAGKNIKLIEQNALGNIGNAVLIAKNFAW